MTPRHPATRKVVGRVLSAMRNGPFAEPAPGELFPAALRKLALLWVGVSVVSTVAASAFVQTADAYVFVLIFMASGAYTTPSLVAGWYVVRRVASAERAGFAFIHLGLVIAYLIGLGMLVGQVTDMRWGNALALPTVTLSGIAHVVGLAMLVRRRSGHRALSVDVIEAVSAVVALTAPLVVLWGPAVLDADAAWFAHPAAAGFFFTVCGSYWTALLVVRLGPGLRPFELCAAVLAFSGALNAMLQTAQGVSGFALPAPPLIALHSICFSMYLLLPLNIPKVMSPGLGRLPLKAQVRGTWFAMLVSMVGLVALLAVTVVTAADRPWAVPFALGTVSLLFVLGGLRHMAAVGETRRLYRQVEEASEERRRLVGQLVDRSVDDQRAFAGRLYAQAVAAYTSFRTLAGAGHAPTGFPSAVTEATAAVGGDLARQAESVRELMLTLRSPDRMCQRSPRLTTPLKAYFSTLDDERPAPRLTVTVVDEVTLDWIAETVLLQIGREALHNVWQHGQATRVDVVVDVVEDAISMQVVDDGEGFDIATVPEGSGIATMRAAAAVIGGTLVIDSRPGVGTSVTARVGPSGAQPRGEDCPTAQPGSPDSPNLRLVPGGDELR